MSFVITKRKFRHGGFDTGGAGPATDTDAQAFFTAAGITDPTQKSAINTLVTALKAAAIWTKMQAIYPFVGGTAATHKFNLKDPRDLDAAFRLSFIATVTQNANGMTGNGTTGYAETFYNVSTNGSQNDQHVSIYSRTAANSGAAEEIGCRDSTFNHLRLDCLTTNQSTTGMNDGSLRNTVNADGSGFFVVSRTAGTDYRLQIRGTNNNVPQVSVAKPNRTLWIGAFNNDGSGFGFSNRNICFASIGTGLSQADASAFHTAVQACQTTLGRNV